MLLDVYVYGAVIAGMIWLSTFYFRKIPPKIRGEIRSTDIANALLKEKRQ